MNTKMSASLSLALKVGASAGAAMSVFKNLQGRMKELAAVANALKKKQGELGATIRAAASLSAPEVARLNEQFARQQRAIDRLKSSTLALGKSQAAIAANEARRSKLRGEVMETIGLGYLVAQPLKLAVNAEEAMADVKKVIDERVPELEQYLLDASRRIPKSFESLTKIAAGGGQGGITRADIEGYVDLVSKMAVSGDLTDEFAGESIAVLKNILGANMEKMGVLGDVINELTNTEATSYAKVIDVMKRSAATAKAFGFSDNQSAGFSATFLTLGKTQETAGTAINSMLLKLQTAGVQGKKFQRALGQIGLTAGRLKKAIGEDAEGALTMFLERIQKLPKSRQMEVLWPVRGRTCR